MAATATAYLPAQLTGPEVGPCKVRVVTAFYLTTCLAALGFGLVQPALRIDPVVVQLTQFGPTIGVLAVLLVWGRQVLPLRPTTTTARTVAARLGAVVAATATIFALYVGVTTLTGVHRAVTDPGRLSHPFLLILAAQLLGACGEECGWRTFLQPYLRRRLGLLGSGVVVGLLWGAWHVQVLARGPLHAAAFLSTTVALSVILAVLLDRLRSGVLIIAGLFHMLINLGVLLLAGEGGGSAAVVILAGACTVTACGVLLLRGSVAMPVAERVVPDPDVAADTAVPGGQW